MSFSFNAAAARGRPQLLALAATASVTGNSAAAINATALTIGANVNNTGLVSAEGCWTTQARACAVVRFSGSYSELNFNTDSTAGGQDGLGFQVGASALAPAPVPALGAAGVATLIMALALLFAWAPRR